MLRIESNPKIEGFTEFEEEILFDADDPDFVDAKSMSRVPILFHVSSNMSLTSVHHPAEIHSNHRPLATLSHSLEDVTEGRWSPQPASDHVLTIEELRLHMTSCFTCGVSWADSHVSLDCSECGGYALERPCPRCEGACGSVWKRDLSTSHACGKARWEGQCAHRSSTSSTEDLSRKLEKLGHS